MLPRKVREAAERADQIHAQVYGNTGTPAPTEPPAEPVPVETPEPPPAEPVEPPAVVADNWEEKYRVLDGKYRAEVPRYAQDIRAMKETIEDLRTELDAAKQPAQPTAAPVDGMTPAQVVEQFGEDFAKAVGAIVAPLVKESAAKVREEFQPELDSVKKRTTETARGAFMRELQALVPEWQQIDTDDQFTAYLDEVDELSGRSRRFFFQEADKHNDAARVAKFFTSFKGTPTAAPARPGNSPAVEALITPSSGRTTDVPKGKRMWTNEDIRQFYIDVRRNLIPAADVKRIESDIFAAQRENRLVA